MILYLLPFRNGRYFKFGVTDFSKRGFDRPYLELDPLYEVDFTKSLKVTSNEKTEVTILENEIKRNYSRYFRTDEYSGKNGASEILPIEFFESVLLFINQKAQLITWQGIKVEKLPEKIIGEQKLSGSQRTKLIKPRLPRKYSDTLRPIDFLFHPYGGKLIEFARKKVKDVTLFESQMPGIFRFMRAFKDQARMEVRFCAADYTDRLVSFSFKETFRDYLDGGITFYFCENEKKKLSVNFRLHDNFLIDSSKGEDPRFWNVNCYGMDGQSIPIDLNKLNDVQPTTDIFFEYEKGN